jgi:hypothetical protein
MTKYTEIDNGSETVIEWNDNGVIRFIPIEPANSDYQAYLKYLEENN